MSGIKSDGSGGDTLSSVTSSGRTFHKIEWSPPKDNSMYHALLETPMEAGKYFWRVTLCQQDRPNYAVGVTGLDHLKKDYYFRGAMFNGYNIHSGSALMQGGYGYDDNSLTRAELDLSHLPPGECTDGIIRIIEVFLDIKESGGQTDVYFVQNGVGRGKAFSLSTTPSPLYLAVTLEGDVAHKSVALIDQLNVADGGAKLERVDPIAAKGGICGLWKLTSGVDEWVGLSMDIRGVEDVEAGNTSKMCYALGIQVVNHMSVRLSCEATPNVWGAGPVACETASFMSTMMMGPPEEMAKEHRVSNWLSNAQLQLELQGPNRLSVSGGNETLTFQREVEDHFDAETGDPWQRY